MSLAKDLLQKHCPAQAFVGPLKPRYGAAAVKPTEFQYTMGYKARGRGVKRTLTWLIPLAQIKSWVRESKPGAITVWPYVSGEEQMIRRQTARVHHCAKANGWLIKTARLSSGLRLMYCGLR